MKIVLDHLASRWDRSVDSLRDDIDRSVEAGADVVSVTEVADGKRYRALRRPGWTVCQDRVPWQYGESAILVRNEDWSVLHWEVVEIGPDLGPGNVVTCIIAVIKSKKTNQKVLVSESHLPSSVEGNWKIKRGLAYRGMVKEYKAAVNRVRKEYDTDAEVIWADWNLDLFRLWIRLWIKGAWRSARAIGKRKEPKQGTHGNRWIDWPLTRRVRKRTVRVLSATKGSDHRGIRLTGFLRR